MNTLLLFALLAVSALCVALWIRPNARLLHLPELLLASLLLLVVVPGFEQPDHGYRLTGFLLAELSAAWLLARLLPGRWMFLLSLVAAGIFWFWKNVQLTYLGYPLLFDAKNVLLLPLAGAAFPLLIRFKSSFLSRMLSVPESSLQNSLRMMGIGILILASLFFGGTYGLMLSGSAYLITEFFITRESGSGGMALLLTGFALWLLKDTGITAESFLHGSTLIGLFGGLGILLWISLGEHQHKSDWWRKAMLFMIPLLLVGVVIFLEKLKEHTGGFSALSGILIAMAFGAAWVSPKSYRLYQATVAAILALALATQPKFRVEQPVVDPTLDTLFDYLSEEGDEAELQNEVPADSTSATTVKKPATNVLTGSWKIVAEKSTLDFELGPPETRTKGAFKTVDGSFIFDTISGKSSVKATIPVSSLTTFNDFRDEGLMGPEFFDQAKFPDITFASVRWQQSGKSIRVQGDFNMHGIKQRLPLNLRILKQGKDAKGAYVLVQGTGKLDRTKHGMDPDPKIGDVVDFTFRLELRPDQP